MTKLNIGFAGTPDFGIPCLNALYHSEHTIKVIYTQPDRPAGRGRKLQASAVKLWALEHAIPVEQPLNFKAQDTRATLQAWELDVLIVIAYGLILPPAVLSAPQFGCINVHASLLPAWRGASPIQQALLQGDALSGVTIMQMDKGMDTGKILLQSEYPIPQQETTQSLHAALAELAPHALMTVLNTLPASLERAQIQNDSLATYAPKINKHDALIHWSESADIIDRKIRAFNPWPIAYTQCDTLSLRIYQAQLTGEPSSQPAGTIVDLTQAGLVVATGSENLCITQLQFPGGKRLDIHDWVRHTQKPLQIGMRFQ
jgi:methionyl-tRNA formyltransferase